MVRDRLKEMQQASKYVKEGEEEAEMKPLKSKDLEFEEFLEVAEEVAVGINRIKKYVEDIRILQKKFLMEPSRSEREKMQASLNDMTEENKVLSRRVQKIIKEEQAKNEKIEKKGKLSTKEMSELRLRKTQINTQSSRFLEIWTEYNTCQVEFRDKAKEALVKNIKITNSQLTDEEIEEKIDKGDASAFSSGILQETAVAKDQLVAIEKRHAEILKLEKSIVEIHDMFMDLHNMVMMQGEIVNRIEDHINSASIDVEKGRQQLNQARRNQIAANKKKIILFSILGILLLIVILIVLSEFGAFSGGGSSETTVIEHHYHLPNGTKIVSDTELTTQTPSTVKTSTPSTNNHIVDSNDKDYSMGPAG